MMKKLSSCFSVISLARQQSVTQRWTSCFLCQTSRVEGFTYSSGSLTYSNYVGCFQPYKKFVHSSFLVQSNTLCTAANPFSNFHSQDVSADAHLELKRRFNKTKSLWAQILRCDIPLVEKLASEHPFFEVLSPLRAEEKINIFTSFGLPVEFVQEQPRFLFHTASHEISRRLKLLQARGFLDDMLNDEVVFKRSKIGSYLEANNAYFDRGFFLLCSNQDALEGCANQCEYLQYRLKCSELEATSLIKTFPIKRGVSHLRLKEILDFLLLEAKIPHDFVLYNIRLFLNLSLRTLRARFYIAKNNDDQMNEYGLLYVWKMRAKEFELKYGLGLELDNE